eukprot:TRINITY_DN7323_c0_g1_i2.p1 TRINITY_DN7323_c0_g1~~TRINITY_DN7323_c0_g1_i2.p1  ORF type:complete len:389 (+),score=66.66 TRINITY_DN7323_c0_g1_i2:905-2071(+)
MPDWKTRFSTKRCWSIATSTGQNGSISEWDSREQYSWRSVPVISPEKAVCRRYWRKRDLLRNGSNIDYSRRQPSFSLHSHQIGNMRIITIILSLIASLLLGACNNTPDHVTLNTVKIGTPALWKVSGTEPGQVGVAYMFGTIHILPDDVQWRTPALEAAIAESDQLIIEVLGLEDTQNAAKIFSRLAISPGQKKLDDRINPHLHDDLDRIIDAANISERTLNRMETWAAALSLASAQTRGLGLDSTGSVEKKLTAQFEKAGKPIEALETIEQQLGYFDKLPEEQQRKMLTSVVEESDDAKQAFELLFNAWMTGDLEHIVTLSDTGILTDPKTRQYLLVARNLDWVEQLDKRLQRPGTSLVAVGAAHLAGPDAVQATLAKRGYKIEKIQ